MSVYSLLPSAQSRRHPNVRQGGIPTDHGRRSIQALPVLHPIVPTKPTPTLVLPLPRRPESALGLVNACLLASAHREQIVGLSDMFWIVRADILAMAVTHINQIW